MIDLFRTHDGIRARASRIHQIEKLAHQTGHLNEQYTTIPMHPDHHEQWNDLADDAQIVAGYADAYAAALCDDPEATTYLRATGNTESHRVARHRAHTARVRADTYTDITHRLAARAAAKATTASAGGAA